MSLTNTSARINALCGKIQRINRRQNIINNIITETENSSGSENRVSAFLLRQNASTTVSPIPFDTQLLADQNITVDGTNTLFTVSEPGIYRVSTYGTLQLVTGQTKTIEIAVNGTPFTSQTASTNAAGLSGYPFMVISLLELDTGDVISIQNSGTAGVTMLLSTLSITFLGAR